MFTETEVILIVLGAFGGFVRSIFGLKKAAERKEKIRPMYFITSIIISAIIGALLGLVFTNINSDFYRIVPLVGYVGTDILDILAKSALPKLFTIQTNE